MSKVASWLYEGVRVLDPAEGREGIVQWIGPFEDPVTRQLTSCAVFLRPEGGGKEWTVLPGALRPADAR